MCIYTYTYVHLSLSLPPSPSLPPFLPPSLPPSLPHSHTQDTVGRPDEEVAAEALASHMQRNNSFIQNLFQGQFRSALICPSCSTRSCTFDPYVCVSLPIPQRDTRPVYITVVYRGAGRKSKVFGVNVSIDSSIRELRNKLAELCGVHRYM